MLDQIERSVNELKKMMQESPDLVDRNLLQEGQKTLNFYIDSSYGPDIKNYKILKSKTLHSALNDLISGGFLLKKRKFELIFRDNKIFEHHAPYNEPDRNGQIVISISLKVFRTENGKKIKINDDNNRLSEEQKQSAIYYLIYLISKHE